MTNAIWLQKLIEQDPPERDETEKRIMDAAYQLFLTFGLRRTTLGQIAKEAGIGRPTLYRRFADKDAVAQAVFLRESRRLIRDVWGQVKDIREPEAMLVESFMAGIRIIAHHPLIRRLLDTEPETILPYLTIKAAPSIEIGHALLGPPTRALQEQGHFPGMDTDYLLETLARLFNSILVTPTNLVDVNDDEKLERFAKQCLMPLVSAGRQTD